MNGQTLRGKCALVTGGGRGIGRAIATGLAKLGARVCVAARSTDQLDDVVAELTGEKLSAFAHRCDVADRESVDALFDRITDEFGQLDILVNNAGGGAERTLVGEDSVERWTEVVELNLYSVYYCSRAAIPLLKGAGGGTIINVGSGMGHQPRRGNSSYNASKAAVWMLTRCLAMELWDDGITVNELVPGPVHTELTKGVFPPAGKPHPSIDSEWVKRPEDVVPIALYLATQGPHGPTGQSFSLARRPI